MSKKFTMLLAALLLGLGATNAQVTKYYKPGERKATFTAGDKVMFYNTALVLNGDRTGISQDRTGFLIGTTSFALDKQKPKNAPIFSEKVGVFTVETVDDQSTYYKVNVRGANGYVGIGGAVNNANASTLCFHKWTTVADNKKTGDDVASENATGEGFVKRTEITDSHNLWIVANDNMGTLWNGNQATFGTWETGHPYAIYSVVEATTAELEDLLAQAKTTAKATLAELANMPLYTVGTAADEVDAVVMENNDLETALNAIDAIVINVKKTIDGKNVTFQNHGSGGRDGRFLGYDKGNSRAATVVKYDNNGDEVIWTMKACDDGTFKLYNFANNLYLGAPGSAATHAAEADAPSFRFAASTSATYPSTFALVCSNGQWVHVENSADNNYKLMSYQSTTDGASLWTISEVGTIHITRDNYNAKSTVLNDLMAYAKQLQNEVGLVTSGENVKVVVNHPSGNDSQPSSNLLDGNNGTFVHSAYSGEDNTTHHYIEVELSKATRNIFCYFSKRNNNNRPAVIKVLAGNSAENITTEVATLTMGESYDGNVQSYFSKGIDLGAEYTHLRFVVTKTNTGSKFFTLSEFYVLPVNEETQNISNLTSASITDADINTKVAAAQSYLKGFLFADVYDVLQANENNHAATPALGQYPTAAYEALEAAFNDDAATQETLEAAVAEFEKSKNLPVFIIESMKEDYALNHGIYEVDASTLKFKAKNEFDKTMWWSFDMTSTEVSCTDRVVVRNVGSGNLFWGAEFVSVIETEPAVEGDGVFMFKTNGTGNPVHAQKDNSAIVRWSSADANTVGGASTWKFTYIGNSYDLREYDDEFAAAYAALETAYIAKRDWLNLFGDGVGQYSGDSESFLAPLTTGTEMLMVNLSVLLRDHNVEDIVSATTAITAMQEADILTNQNFTLNLPAAGKYYRIKGANTGAENYVTGYLRTAGDRIALQAEANGATVFQYLTKDNGDGILLAVENNLYLALNSWAFKLKKADAAKTEFAASTRKAGAYTIKSGGSFFHYDNGFLNRCGSDGHTAHDWYLEEVAAGDVPANTNLLTDINNLSGEASYRIYGDRGFIYVADDGHMKGTNVANVTYNPNNDKHHFAIVTIGGNKYLYNVGAKKFVMKKNNGVTLTDWPEQAITIEARTDLSTDYDWVIKLGDNRLNLSTGDGHTYGVFTNHNTEDPGNVWAIYKVGSFAPAEAQSMKKVIVNYTIDGVAATETVGVAAGGTLNFSYEFATVTSCKMGEEAQTITDGACSVTIQDNVTISVAMTSDNRLFRLKNTASSKYMTIVTPEAAEGVQIKDKADDPVKQAFRIVLANWQGKYNIKSTENYFMASSTGGWDYGAYQTTTNEAGRAHELEALGEGKYGLKTLNGYAGPNSGVTADGSPLYSNHGAGNSGREWELEELTKSSITYIYKWNDQTIESEVHENVYEGLAAPATAVTLPFGFSYDAASLPTTKGAGNQEVEIACTLILPFQYANSYEAIETNGYWYYLKFDSGNNYYLHHAAGQDHIALDSKAVDKKNKDVYSWGFVGDPVNGYKIVNKAAGNTMILSSSTTMEGETGAGTWPIMTVEEGLPTGNNTLWIPTDASTHATNGFFLAQKEFPDNRLNNRGKLAYWTGGAGTGSTFVVEARPFGPAAELEDLLIEAEELKAVVVANTGDKIGEYSEATATALANAITTAKGVTEATADDVTALENVVLGTKINLPTAGTYYQIHSALFTETKAVYSNGNAPMWKALNEYDRSFYWKAVETADGGIALQNVQDNKYMNGASNQSGAWTVSDTPSAIDVKILTKDEHVKGYQYGIILNDWQLHANGHGEGSGNSGSIVSYNTEKDNASAWYIVEAALPSFFPVTYKFNYGGETKYTQEKLVAVGGAYPAMDVFLPYGVTSNFELPAGTVQEASEHVFELTVNKALPFEAVAEGNTPSKWYYAQMHAFPGYAFYVSADENNMVWHGTNEDAAKYIDEAADLDDYLWGFVGDLWTGFKLVNKAGKAVSSTGSGAVTVVDDINNATKFIASNSQADGEWFCLKYPTNGNYLNLDAYKKIIQHYDQNDNGSSFFVTEYNKQYSLNMATDEATGESYATFYSQYRVAIPEGVTAWVVSSIENNEVVLDEVTGGVLPANTAVILTGETKPIVTSAAATATVGTNLLRGTATKTLIEAAANTSYYVLAKGENGVVKLYKALVNKNAEGIDGNTHFYNNANKVYLPVEIAEPQVAQALAFRFRGKGQGTTEIEMPATNDQQPAVIYDLTGRRITEIVEKGIYIVNGKKVVIK